MLPKTEDRAALPLTTDKDTALVHQLAGDEELEEEIHNELAGTLIENKLCVETAEFCVTVLASTICVLKSLVIAYENVI